MSRSTRTGVFELPETPEFEDLIKVYGRRLRLSMHTNTVGTVIAYNPLNQTATIQVDLLEVVKVLSSPLPGVDPNAINLVAPQPPIILNNIPVVYPRGQTGYLTFPIVPGTTGVLTIMERSIQSWLNRPTSIPVDPYQSATHALQDAIFEPGLTDNLNRITPPTSLVSTVLHDDIQIQLGRLAALGNARLSDTVAPDANMISWMLDVTIALVNIATILNAAPGPVLSAPGSVPVFPTTPPSPNIGVISSASTKVLSE
jgi:hypothetical protein